MKIRYTQIRPRDSVWMRTVVDKDGQWSIIVGQVASACAESVMLWDVTEFPYKLSRGLGQRKANNATYRAEILDAIHTLGS